MPAAGGATPTTVGAAPSGGATPITVGARSGGIGSMMVSPTTVGAAGSGGGIGTRSVMVPPARTWGVPTIPPPLQAPLTMAAPDWQRSRNPRPQNCNATPGAVPGQMMTDCGVGIGLAGEAHRRPDRPSPPTSESTSWGASCEMTRSSNSVPRNVGPGTMHGRNSNRHHRRHQSKTGDHAARHGISVSSE